MSQSTTIQPHRSGILSVLLCLLRTVSGGKLLVAWLLSAWVLLGTSNASAADKYLLLNYSPDGFCTPDSSATIMNYVASTFGAANQASVLKVGVSCIYMPGMDTKTAASELALLRSDLERAELLGVPILVQVDTETWLPPSLLNWYDDTLPGYDPAKKADVEWYDWDDSTAVKLSWRNWGFPFRIGPTPNFLSPNFQAYEKGIYDLFLPVVLEWYNELPPGKKWLLAGWKCGWESAINSNYRFFPDGNSYYYTPNENPVWNDNYQPLGYNAAQTAGIKTSGTLTSADNAKIVGKHLTYLAKLAYDAGIPREKISVHGTFYGTAQENVDALVNLYGDPAVSFYGNCNSPLKGNTALMQAVQTAKASYGATGYGYGEFNLGTQDYNSWFTWFKNALHDDLDCTYQSIYNYDTMYGHTQPAVEQAMLDAMALYPTPPPPTDGVWSLNGEGLWSANVNWTDGNVANDTGFSANFSAIDITADRTVHLDSARIIGNLVFGDANNSSAAGWTLDNNGNVANVLTLAGTTPTITVNPMGAGKTTTIFAQLAGTNGLTKAGDGTLVLSGGNTYTGTTHVNAGTLILAGSGSINEASPLHVDAGATLALGQAVTRNTLTLDGGTLTVCAPDNTGTGGIISYSGGRVIHAFTTTGTSSLMVPMAVTAEVLVVAGGGGGGYNCGGGGGAGGLIYYGAETPANGHAEGTSYAITAGSHAVTVGAGGLAGSSTIEHGESGGDSWLDALQAIGGGGAAGRDYAAGNLTGGTTGGSGGGGSGCSGNIVVSYPGSGTSGQGYAGGAGTSDYGVNSAGGGGGGAGATGGAGTESGPGGNGGNGLQYSLSGLPAWYAGGGAGLGYQQEGALGGLGGGGNQSQAATPNTGGGGGGGSAGAGGSGSVIVSYPRASLAPVTTLSGPITLAATSTLDAVGTGGHITVNSSMTGAGGITIASSTDAGGSVTIAAVQNYDGPTVIASGTLKLDGSLLALPGNAALDLDASAGVTTNSSGQVTSWTDQSGAGNDATGISGAYPTLVSSGINGNPAVYFNGNSRMTNPLSVSIGSAETIIAVIISNSSSQIGTLIGPASGDGIQFRLVYNQLNLLRENTQGLGASSGTLATGTAAIVAATTTSGSQAFYINGVAAGTSSTAYTIVMPNETSALGYNWSGPGELLDGYIAELLVYPRVLSAAELAQATACLNAKWLGVAPSNILPPTTALSVTGGTLDLGGLSQQVASLDGGGNIINSNPDNASVLTLNHASGSTTFTGVLGGGSGALGLVKTGDGTQVLAGSNTYTGTTTVDAGTLVLATAGGLRFVVTNATSNRLTGSGAVTLDGTFSIDTSAVTSATGTWSLVDVTNLTESFGATFGVAGFTRSADGFTWTKTASGKAWTFNKTTGELTLAASPYTPYQSWAMAKGLTEANNATGMDPDGDGTTNLTEYACNGDPLNGTDNGKVHLLTADNDSSKKLILTIAVCKDTPAFAGDPSPTTAVWDGIIYTIEGSNDLSNVPVKVNVLAVPVVPATDHDPGSGYEYRSFSLNGSIGLPTKGFLRAKVTQQPD
jgi:autotransporter-associated beta strand protein